MCRRREEWRRRRLLRRRRVARLLPFTGAGHPRGSRTLGSEAEGDTRAMPDGEQTAPLRPEARAADERAAAVREAGSAAGDAPPRGGEHPVADAGGALRLASESAARPEAERRDSEEITALVGEEPPDSATGFYIMLGVIVAALLLGVIWRPRSAREAPETALYRRFPAAPVTRPVPGGLRSRTTFPPSRAPGQRPSRGETVPGQPGLQDRTSWVPVSPASAGPVPGEAADHSLSGPFTRPPAAIPPLTRGRPGSEPPLSPLISPGVRIPSLPGELAAPGRLAPGPASPGTSMPGTTRAGTGTLPAAASGGKPGESRFLHPPSYPPLAPGLPTR
jgi:hypothetical protein